MQSKNLIKISAAGSGKTYGICKQALEIVGNGSASGRVLVVTYTNRGVQAVETELMKQNRGIIDTNIDVFSWYKFLLSQCIKPFQTYLFNINEIKSYDFKKEYGYRNFARKGTRDRYLNSNSDVLPNEAAELALQLNTKSNGAVLRRLATIYNAIFIDEIQDMAGYDLNIVYELMKTGITILCVGDNKQATFKTNTSPKNKNKSGKNVWEFFKELYDYKMAGIERSLVSRRFNSDICSFANALYSNENNMTTIMNDKTEHDGVYIIKKDDVITYYSHFQPQVLRYDVNTKDIQGLSALNFGVCKGMTFDRVMIFPNNPLKDYILKRKKLSSPEKYYVAVTRPRYSLAFVLDELPCGDYFEKCEIKCDTAIIESMKIKTNNMKL